MTIEPKKATGKLSSLWIDFAKFYETHEQDLTNCRLMFEKAVKSDYRTVDELASVWAEYAEMELRHQYYSIFILFYFILFYLFLFSLSLEIIKKPFN